MRRGKPQPFPAYVVDVGEDGGDGSHVAAGKLGAPRAGIQICEDELVHTFVGRPDFQE